MKVRILVIGRFKNKQWRIVRCKSHLMQALKHAGPVVELIDMDHA